MPYDYEVLEIARLIRLAGNSIRSWSERDANEVGLTAAQAEVLYILQDMENPRIGDLAKTIGVTHQAACALIDRMAAKNLVSVKASEEDGRVRIVNITPEGMKAHENLNRLGLDTMSPVLGNLNEQELADLKQFLIRICNSE